MHVSFSPSLSPSHTHSNQARSIIISGINSTRTGATKIVASKVGAYVRIHKALNSLSSTWSGAVSFLGALELHGGDGVFVNDSLTIGGALVVDANANSLAADSFYCIDGNTKLSCASDADCGRSLCSDGVTFCDGGQGECSGTVCNVPSGGGSCVSKGEFRITHNLSIASGGASITADALLLMPQKFEWDTSNSSIGGHLLVHHAGAVSLQPKTVRAVRVGQLAGGVDYWRPYQVLAHYGTTFAIDARTLDAIHMLGDFTIGGVQTSSITVTGLTLTRSPGFLSLVATHNAAATIALVNAPDCAALASLCHVSIQGALYLTTLGSCLLQVDVSVFLMTAACEGATSQTGTLLINGAGVDLEYIAVGDVVISGNIINQDRMLFQATGHVNISSDLTCRGRMTITADSDNDGEGDFNLAAGSVLTSQNNPIDIRANTVAFGGAGSYIRAGYGDISITVSDAGEIGLNTAAAGMEISAAELEALSCRNLSIGGVNSHVRIGPLATLTLAGVKGYLVIRALLSGAQVSE